MLCALVRREDMHSCPRYLNEKRTAALDCRSRRPRTGKQETKRSDETRFKAGEKTHNPPVPLGKAPVVAQPVDV